jgi:hypothetical protein
MDTVYYNAASAKPQPARAQRRTGKSEVVDEQLSPTQHSVTNGWTRFSGVVGGDPYCLSIVPPPTIPDITSPQALAEM